MRRRHTLEIGTAIVMAAAGVYLLFGVSPRPHGGPITTAAPATTMRPTTTPATRPATQALPAAVAAEIDAVDGVLAVVRLDEPTYPTTQPLDLPVDLADAAKIILTRPAYVDPLGNLWLAHPKGQSIARALSESPIDHTIVVREPVDYVNWPVDGGPASAVCGRFVTVRPEQPIERDRVTRISEPDFATLTENPTGRPYQADHNDLLMRADFTRAQPIMAGVVVPGLVNDAPVALRLSTDLHANGAIELPGLAKSAGHNPVALAVSGDGVWAWSPWENGKAGSGAIFIDAAGGHVPDAAAGWPDKPIEVVPLADGSVLVVAASGSVDDVTARRSGVTLKLIPAADKPPTPDLLRTIQPLAKQLADPDPLQREAAQRALEAQGPAAYPVLESLREQLPPEAQVRIETLLGQRFAPSLGGLRPLEGACRTIARFPGGGCVLRLDGGGTIDADGDTPERSVIPATILIRPGHYIERIDPEAAGDFVPGRQSIQWVGGELIVSDPVKGPQKWVGRTWLPILPKTLADFDTVVAIDARRRWLLTSAKRPGTTLLIDPSLPDITPKLPVWTIGGDSVGRTAAGWPAVKRGDRLFVLERDGWKVDKPDKLSTDFADATTATDDAGRRFTTAGHTASLTDARGGHAQIDLPGGISGAIPIATIGRLLIYTPDGNVRRYQIGDGPTLSLEATFTQGVPTAATHVWLDPAGRMAMTTANAIAVGFPDGRVPAGLGGMMLSVDR